MSRPTHARLSQHALQHNIQLVRSYAPHAQLMAMVKANAYGHGLRSVSTRIEPWVDGFGVATLDEAIALRAVGIHKSIHIMQGILRREEATQCIDLGCVPVVSRYEQLVWLENALCQNIGLQPFFLWIKVQTGLNRLGFEAEDLPQLSGELNSKKEIFSWGLMTHWSCADAKDHPYHAKQYARVVDVLQAYPEVLCSVNSSAGIVQIPEFNCGWVRAGAVLYGIHLADLPLLPVMELRSEIILIRHCAAGECIGYGGQDPLLQPMRIAIVTIGYGDGYPRNIHGATALVRMQRCAVVGRVSMDMLALDVTALADVAVGDAVVLWGDGLPVDEIARCASTIAYELVSGICHRVKFYWDDGAPTPQTEM